MSTYITIGEHSIEVRSEYISWFVCLQDLISAMRTAPNHFRELKYIAEDNILWLDCADESGRTYNKAFINEGEMYRYLIRLKTPESETFHHAFDKKLKEERRRLYDKLINDSEPVCDKHRRGG